MLELKKIYNKTSKQTQNRLQEIFDSIDFKFDKLYSIADNKQKNKIDTYIEEWKDKGLLTGYFGVLANSIYKRTRVKNSEILELLIYSAYIEEQYKLKDKELNIFKEDVNYYYQEGQREVNKTLNKEKIVSVIPDAIFIAMLDIPNSKGYVYNDYIQSILKYNAEQLYRQVVIDIQQEKTLKIDSDVYQNIIGKQQNQKLNINNNKISGDVDLTLIGLNNLAKSEAIYLFDKKAKVKFVSVEDEVTTKMCKSLNGQVFKVHDWNEFERYSETNKTVKKYKCYGLIPGLNLPPINDNFHWCRSSIIYDKTLEKTNMIMYTDYEESDILESLKNKTKQFIYDGKIIKFEELPKDYKDNFIKRLSYSENNTKLILNKLCNNTDYIITNDVHSTYNELTNVVKINTNKDTSTLAHELFHKLDKKYNISGNARMRKVLDSDFTNISLNKNDIINKISEIDSKAFVYNSRGKLIFSEEYRGLADIINGYSNGKIKLGYIHSNDYWKKNKKIEKEAFAQFGRMYYQNNKNVINTLEKLLPTTKRYIDYNLRKVMKEYV